MCRSCDQGGTCIFAGDQHELLLEAAQIAEVAIGCHAVFGVPFPAPEGYSREAFNAMDQDARYFHSLLHQIHMVFAGRLHTAVRFH